MLDLNLITLLSWKMFPVHPEIPCQHGFDSGPRPFWHILFNPCCGKQGNSLFQLYEICPKEITLLNDLNVVCSKRTNDDNDITNQRENIS
jgi:hypothetical protein